MWARQTKSAACALTTSMDSCWLTGLPPGLIELVLIEQGRDDTAQVAAGGLLSFDGAAPGDCVDDRHVLVSTRTWRS
jgi:hypothetical protein